MERTTAVLWFPAEGVGGGGRRRRARTRKNKNGIEKGTRNKRKRETDTLDPLPPPQVGSIQPYAGGVLFTAVEGSPKR